MNDFLDVIAGAFLFAGCLLTLISAVGIARYPDVISRQHVATKPQVLSLIFNLLGTALLVREATMTWTMLLVVAFMLITAPISAHMLSRAAYRTGRVQTDNLVADELGEDLRLNVDPGDNGNTPK
ncbi:monovalent cation/H(+) antiporter subunit G [Changpingibacter yushuensis]|uniref:monovalent cation/H(+) antiporter subunit G n=1 Tax=Changpingibacter yushuensis TaxID=2758440 RepID=UPI0015F613C8|nr:monovalent cation/H(+) antiporter subunit G [Changpingibacter yushuensis]